MPDLPFAIYDAFTSSPFGGSQAAIVRDAGELSPATRLQIAREFNLPATCFVAKYSTNEIFVRFQSTEREYPMCGHGTICLLSYMLDQGFIDFNNQPGLSVKLKLPKGDAMVEIVQQADERPMVMLDVTPPDFRIDEFDEQQLAHLLGLSQEDFDSRLPVETAVGDFTHLVVPVASLEKMQAITPDIQAIKHFCKTRGIETVACFCRQTEQKESDIHVRDFCPAVGVAESAAAGTTNAALASYLVRHDKTRQGLSATVTITAEQGLEIGRPSKIHSIVHIQKNTINRLQVGGVAAAVATGTLQVPG